MSEPADSDVLVVEPAADACRASDGLVVVAAGRVHQLNPSAAEIWRACDGVTPVGALVERLAGRFGVDPSVIRADVRHALAEFVDQGLVVPVPRPPSAGPVLEPAALCASCGPGPRYARHVLVDLGDRVATIGCDDRLAPALHAAFGDRAIGVDTEPTRRPSYGLLLDRSEVDAIRPLHRLHRGPDVLVAHRDPERPVRALVTLLSRHARPGPGYLDALAIGDDRGVALIRPPSSPTRLARAAEAAGFALDDGVSVLVEPDGTARLGPATDDDIDWSALRAELPRPATRRAVTPPLHWGAVRVSDVVVHGAADVVGAFAELGPALVDAPEPVEPLQSFFRRVVLTKGTDAAVLDLLARRRTGVATD